MEPQADPVEIAMRIPGTWNHPGELLEKLPAGYRITGKELILPDGTEIEFNPVPADEQFAEIFRTSCRNPPTDGERATVENYKVNILLCGPGGSRAQARAMMSAAAAIMRAGAGGVFIDNCMLAHGAEMWLSMDEDGGPEALSYAYTTIMASETEVWTMGLHCLGMPDILMKKADADDFDIIEVIRYCAGSEKRIGHGHVLADLDGPRFQAFAAESPADYRKSPMHNPWGRLRLVSMKDVSSSN